MRNQTKTYIKAIWLILPFILGLISILMAGEKDIFEAMYQTVQMYVLCYGGDIVNPLMEVARWLAPLATASGILMALSHVGRRMRNGWKYLRGNSVAVYGRGDTARSILKQLGRRGMAGDEELVRAHSYILLNSEEENLAFYKEYREQLKDTMVYLKCRTLDEQALADANLKLFCPEETAARLFWKSQQLYELSCSRNHQLDLAFVGFGRLGEELLLRGLQNLIFSPEQKIRYHVMGDGAEFLALHPQLSQVEDEVRFYPEAWYQYAELLEQADMVIVLEQEEQTALLSDMLRLLCRPEIYVLAQDAFALELLAGKERLQIFAWEEEAENVENILEEKLLYGAKQMNLRYVHIYNQVAETAENAETEWKMLDTFTRYSNISSADYHEVRLHMLSVMNHRISEEEIGPHQTDSVLQEPDAQTLEFLAELEHIRWCRYHYLNNWHFGDPGNGKRKDMQLRIHADLIPYQELTEGEKEKDRENIRLLLSIE